MTGGTASGADAGGTGGTAGKAGSNAGGAGTAGSTSDAGAAGVAGGAGAGTEPNREWALWPMPNPASAGLPHPSSYDTTTNALVAHDQVTDLTWPRMLDPNYTEAVAARTKCRDLVFAGYDDWRLPSMIEMFSLVDFTRTLPAIDTAVFRSGGISFDLLWTTSPSPVYPDDGSWVMDLALLSRMNTHPVSDTFPSLCVRGGSGVPAGSHYMIEDDAVLDTYTGLTWERNASLTKYEQQAAASYCDALALAGKDDWRLPSINETATLYAFGSSRYPPMDATAFPDDGSSSLTLDYWNAGGFTFSFNNLLIVHPNDVRALRARCVR